MRKLESLKKAFALLLLAILLSNCEQHPNDAIYDEIKVSVQANDSLSLNTVSQSESLDILDDLDNALSGKAKNPLKLFIKKNSLRYERLSNSDTKVAIIEASTKFKELVSEVSILRVDNTLETTVLHRRKDGYSKDGSYSGMVVCTDFLGTVWYLMEVKEDDIIGEYNLDLYHSEKSKSAKAADIWMIDPCWGITCGIELDEVVVSPPKTYNPPAYPGMADPRPPHQRNYTIKRSYSGYAAGYVYYQQILAKKAKWEKIIITSKGKKINPKDELKCFDGSKGGKLTIYVQQPRENTLELNSDNGVGHVAIGLEQGGTSRYFGFYPPPSASDIGIGLGKIYDSEIRDNSGDLYHVSISKDITASQMNNIINYAENYPKKYDLNNYACTDFGIKIGNLGGIPLKSTTIELTIVPNFLKFEGRSPAYLGQEIRAMKETSTLKIKKTKGNIPTKSKEKC